MKIVFICPFKLERLTGTPIRAKITISALKKTFEVFVVEGGNDNVIAFTKKTFKVLRESRPGIVHGFTPISIIPMLLYKIFFQWKTKIIFEIHGFAWYELKGKVGIVKRPSFLFLDLLGLWIADVVIAVSHAEKNFLAKKTLRADRIRVIWDPVDFLTEYALVPKRPYIKVGYIGNSERWQGLPHLIEAAKILKEDISVQFDLAGFDAGDDNKFPKLKNIKYSGRVERKDIVFFLQSCDILISGRLEEEVSNLQFPHKLSEYLAVGRPVIVSKTSDQPFVVMNGHCGFILEKVDGKSIVKAIREFQSLPEEEKIKLGRNAREFCKRNLYIDTFVSKLGDVYARLTK